MLLIQPDLQSWAMLQSFKTSTYQIYILRGKLKSSFLNMIIVSNLLHNQCIFQQRVSTSF